MPRVCQVCQHREVALIDDALVKTASIRRVATEYGLSYEALRRHKREHLPELILEAHKRGMAQRGANLIEDQVRLLEKLDNRLTKIEADAGNFELVAVMREMRGQIRQLAELRGEIDTSPTIVLKAEFREATAILIGALTPYPEAKAAVVRAFEELEAGNAA